MARLSQTLQLKLDGSQASKQVEKLHKDIVEVGDAADDVDFDEAAESAKKAESSVSALGKSFREFGPQVADVALKLFAIANEAADAAIEADDLATGLNTSTEEASRLNEVFGRFGLDVADTTDLALQTAYALEQNTEWAARLGLKMEEVGDPVASIKAAIDGWDLLSATDRAKIFGEEGVRQVARIVAQGGNLEDMLAGVSGSKVFDDAAIAKAREMKESVREVEDAVAVLRQEFGEALGPAIVDAANQLDNLMSGDFAAFGLGVIENMVDPMNIFSIAVEKAGGPTTWAGLLTSLGFIEELQLEIGSAELAMLRFKGEAALTGTELMDTGIIGVESIGRVERAIDEAKEATNEWKASLDVEAAATRLATSLSGAIGGTRTDMAKAERDAISWISTLDDVPKSLITDLRASFSSGTLAEIYSDIEAIRRAAGQPIPLDVYVPTTSYGRGPDGGPRYRSDDGPGTTVNITMAGQPSSRELSSQVNYWRQRS